MNPHAELSPAAALAVAPIAPEMPVTSAASILDDGCRYLVEQRIALALVLYCFSWAYVLVDR